VRNPSRGTHTHAIEPPRVDGSAIAELSPQSLLALQRTAGNSSVSALIAELNPMASPALQREPAAAVAPAPAETEVPDWDNHQLDSIQRQLRRLGLYHMAIDHRFGRGTEAGLVEAFGGNDWRKEEPDVIIGQLTKVKTPKKGAQHKFRYGELFKDGVLDMTVGLGFTEEMVTMPDGTRVPYYLTLLPQFEHVLVDERGFKKDTALAEAVLKQTGRTLDATAVGEFFVLKNALIYTPPVGGPRFVHVVVRLLADKSAGPGGDIGAAFEEGMAQSDVAYYTGHGRYGSGPDFDKNFNKFELLDAAGNVTRPYDGGDYEVLGHDLGREGKPFGRSDFDQFLWRVKHNRINVFTSDLGNVYLNPKRREREFGAKLIYWALERDGKKPITGKGGALEAAAAAHPEHKYHVDVFDGCRTRDYETSIHGTAGQDAGSTDIIQTKRTVGFLAESATFAAFLDSIIGQHSAETVIKDMNNALKAKEPHYSGAAFETSGQKYDPTGP
jgi:hypothetical protein